MAATPIDLPVHRHDPGYTPDEIAHQARHLVRLLIALHHLGTPTRSLWDGETRQIESIGAMQRFEFWLREPGHLALALLYVLDTPRVATANGAAIRETIGQLLIDDSIDRRRVHWPGAPLQSLPDLYEALSFLSSRALVSDRPSFGAGSHQIVLEAPGVAFVERVLKDCPAFGWYDFLGQTVARFWPILEALDLNTLAYLQPDLKPVQAARLSLIPFVRRRLDALPPLATTAAIVPPPVTPP